MQGLSGLDFKALIADLKPGNFEEMARSALARRDEQTRLDKARKSQQPREQDLQASPGIDARRDQHRRVQNGSDAESVQRTQNRTPERTRDAQQASRDDMKTERGTALGRAAGETIETATAAQAGASGSGLQTGASAAGATKASADHKASSAGSDDMSTTTRAATDSPDEAVADEATAAKSVASASAARPDRSAPGAEQARNTVDADPLVAKTESAPAEQRSMAARRESSGHQNNGQDGNRNRSGNAAVQSLTARATTQASTSSDTALPTTMASSTTAARVNAGTDITSISSVGHTDLAAPGVGVASPVNSGHSPVRADGSPLLGSRIDSAINTPEFKEQFARQVASLVVQGQDRAEIRLNPAELGPIRIRLSLSADDAQLDISAAHAATRSAIESSISQLRQLLSDQGIRLSEYRMDNGQNPAFAQNRQPGQEFSSGMQQSTTASGQGDGQPSGGHGGNGQPSTHRAPGVTAGRPADDTGPAGGAPRPTFTTGNRRVDLFA